jgi:hypothetical protein
VTSVEIRVRRTSRHSRRRNGGAGALHFGISRGAPFVDGVRFDVQWRLEGNDGSILQSDCLTVTVK